MTQDRDLLNTPEEESPQGHPSKGTQESQGTSSQETPTQGTPQDWEKRYRDLQAFATKTAQEKKELEQKLSQIEAHFRQQQQLTRQQQIEQFKRKFIQDPIGALEEWEQKIRQGLMQQVTPFVIQQRIFGFRERHRDEFPDEATFNKVGEELASIIEEHGLANAKDPLEAAYRIWKGQNVNDELRKKIEEEVKRKMGYTESEGAGMPEPTPEEKEEVDRIINANKPIPF